MPKHIPLRTCIACRQSKPKRQLIRVVRTPGGEVIPDATGKKPGRGAYLCAAKPCWDMALKKKLLEHTLQCTIDPAGRATLETFGNSQPMPESLPVARMEQPSGARTAASA
jgi:uncharacterized protein